MVIPQDEFGTAEELRHLDDELAELLAASVSDTAAMGPMEPMEPHHRGPGPSHRRPPRVLSKQSWMRAASVSLAALSTLVVTLISVFGAVVSYPPLRQAASEVLSTPGVARCWPLLVFAPWLVAYFTIMRATLHRKRALRAWSLAAFCAALAMSLCVSEAPKNLVGILVAALPPLAALASFAQYMGQLALTRPPRSRRSHSVAAHRPRPVQENDGTKLP